MKKMTVLFVLVLAIVTATAVSAQTTDKPYYGYEKVVIDGATWVVPDYINIEKFPPLGGKLSARDARILELHQRPLREAGWYVNEVRARHTFEVIWLDKGTMILASNASGEPRYLASCGNRISFLLAHQVTRLESPAPTQPWPRLRIRAFWRWLGDLFTHGPLFTVER